MVSTRQSSNISSSGENGIGETGAIKTRHNVQNLSKVSPSSTTAAVSTAPVAAQNQTTAEHVRQLNPSLHILDLPQEILDKIFSYVGYKNVSQMRLVNRQFNLICSSTLNSTFQRLQNQMLARFQGIKSKMPRRESARRNHPLACESDIVETLHMRLTLLQMTFGKHIERKHCCFFAGEILDEVYRILNYIKVTPKLTRPYRVTDELFDLSTMAMEYFKEHIEPTLPEISYFSTDFLDFSTNGLTGSGAKKTWIMDSPPHTSSKVEYESPSQGEERPPEQTPQPQSNTVLRKRIRKINQGMKKYSSQLALYKRELKHCKSKLAEHQNQFLEMVSRMDDHDKKNDETARKFSTLLQELNKCKTELQYWRSKSPLLSLCPSCGQNIGGGLMEGFMVGGVVGGWGMEGGGSAALEGPSDLVLDQPPAPSAPVTASSLPETPPANPQPSESMTLSPSTATKRKSLPDSTPYVLPKKSKKSRLKPILKASQRTRRS